MDKPRLLNQKRGNRHSPPAMEINNQDPTKDKRNKRTNKEEIQEDPNQTHNCGKKNQLHWPILTRR